ncbi:hypothetical protein OIE63_31805 [Streptomyces sp. NBC_01795]|uniref:hypothetical protein n=1 Tax=Streptomyces sp. NBC_01795 TaxID=2975943 RepID=UPI002DD91BE6|nr:hypothetical protein [Streptomyces sp. NBC_01795]WSA95637.1 hypothetical protein OIE63_31805 [Streptomyces sp. NBC_01795]
MRASAFVYPWDIVGDPEAPGRLAALGVQQVTLASAYHSTRALTPRHPRHRVVTARHSAVLYPPEAHRWTAGAPRPYTQDWLPSEDPGGPYAEAARALTGAGLDVHSWVVLAHNSRLGEDFPHTSVRNAYGDRYPWAPCVARPEVRSYAVALAAEAAVRHGTGTRGTELESCGWYGFAHLHAHDKVAGVPLDGVGAALMSLCFCEVCEEGYAGLGADPGRLRRTVIAALEPLWRGERSRPAPGPGGRAGERAALRALLGTESAALFATWRGGAARRLQREAVAAVREEAARGPSGGAADFRVLLHADPALHRTGANAGTEPADVLAHADGVVVPCPGGAPGADERADALGPFAAHAGGTTTLAANFTVVSGMGGSPGTLADDAAHARSLGAHELRLYHAGLASVPDLESAAAALRQLR